MFLKDCSGCYLEGGFRETRGNGETSQDCGDRPGDPDCHPELD